MYVRIYVHMYYNIMRNVLIYDNKNYAKYEERNGQLEGRCNMER